MPSLALQGYLQDSKIGAVKSVFYSGYYLYTVGSAETRFVIVDVQDSANPAIISSLQDANRFSATAGGIFVVGDYAYVHANNYFTIVSISNKTSPSVVGTIASVNLALSTNYESTVFVQSDGNYAYVITPDSNNYLRVIDCTNKAAPAIVGSLALGGRPASIVVDGNYAYIADTTGTAIKVVDVTTKNAPTLLATLTDAVNLASANKLVKSGDFLYVSCTGRIVKVDVSTPATPVLVASRTDAKRVGGYGLDVDANYLYAGRETADRLSVFDKAKFTNISPKLVATLTDSTNLDQCSAVIPDGDYTYVIGKTATGRLTILDTSDKSNPSVKSTLTDALIATPESGDIDGNSFYITPGTKMQRISVADKSAPAYDAKIGHRFFGGTNSFTKVKDGFLYAMDGNSARSLIIADLSRMTTNKSPSKVSEVQDNTKLALVHQTFKLGNYVYCLAATRLTIVDVTDPANPTVRGSVTDAKIASAGRMFVSGTHAYIPCGGTTRRLTIVDITDKDSPSVDGSLQDSTNLTGAFAVAVAGNYAYVSCSTLKGVTVVDVSDSTSPTYSNRVVDTTKLNGCKRIHISGNYAYVAAAAYFVIIDISTPTAISIAGSLNDATHLTGGMSVWSDGTYAYQFSNTAAYTYNISVIDVSNKAAPSWVSWISTGGQEKTPSGGRTITVDGEFLYMANEGTSTSQVRILDIKDPARIVSAHPSGEAGTAMQDAVQDGNYVYGIDGTAGVNKFYVNEIFNYKAGVLRGRYASATYIYDCIQFAVEGDYVYVTATNSDRFSIIDVSDKDTPTLRGTLVDNTYLDGVRLVEVKGNYAYVFGTSYLAVIDITDKDDPTLVGYAAAYSSTTPYSCKLSPDGNYIFLYYRFGTSVAGIRIYDVADKAAPIYIGGISVTRESSAGGVGANKVELVGNYLYVPNYYGDNIQVLDMTSYITDMFLMQVTDNTLLDGLRSVRVDGSQIYVGALTYGGIVIIGLAQDVSSFTPKVILI